MDILIKAAQLVLALVILVTIHEFGHYIFARIFGMKVERFYLFFNPWFSLLRYDPMAGTLEVIAPNDEGRSEGKKPLFILKVGKKHEPDPDGRPTWRDTIYGLGWIPLGGYCSIAGMVDETQDAASLSAEPQSWEFRSKPAWQRLCVMVAGVVLNFVLAIAIYVGIAFHWGDDVIPFQAMTEGMDFSTEMKAAGFEDGDILVSLNGKPLDATDYSLAWDMIQPGARIGVLRNGSEAEINITDELLRSIVTKGKEYVPMTPRIPVYVAKVVNGEPAAKAGLEPRDRILKVGNDTTPSITEFLPALACRPGQETELLVERADGSRSLLPVTINENGKIGIQMLSPTEIFDRERISYNLVEAVPRGWQIGVDRLTSYVSSLKLVFTKEGAQSLGGFGTLGDLFPNHWNWYTFWQITAFLSIILAFMNIIPIPGLDGGHTLFLLIEMVTRRKLPEELLEKINMAGFFFLLLLLIYANGNDIYRFFLK